MAVSATLSYQKDSGPYLLCIELASVDPAAVGWILGERWPTTARKWNPFTPAVFDRVAWPEWSYAASGTCLFVGKLVLLSHAVKN